MKSDIRYQISELFLTTKSTKDIREEHKGLVQFGRSVCVKFEVSGVLSFVDHEPNKCEAFNERPHKVLVDFQDLSSVKHPAGVPNS